MIENIHNKYLYPTIAASPTAKRGSEVELKLYSYDLLFNVIQAVVQNILHAQGLKSLKILMR